VSSSDRVPLKIELVPRPLWGKSLAALARKNNSFHSRWQAIRQKEFTRTRSKCESCGGEARSLHEIWEYDDTKHVQCLAGFETVCDVCSLAQHMGRAGEIGRADEAEQHIATVNHISREEVRAMLKLVGIAWWRRSQHSWTQDLSWLRDRASQYGITAEDVDQAQKQLASPGWKKPAGL